MIKAILSYQFELNMDESGEVEPEFRPIQLVFHDKKYNADNYDNLLIKNDLYGVFYQHTSGFREVLGKYTNFYIGRLKRASYQVVSYFQQEHDGTQFIVVSVFELHDEVELFKEVIEDMGEKLKVLLTELLRAKNSRRLNLIEKVNDQILNELKFAIFQIERLSNLTKIQKAALIFKSKERLAILNRLRETPCSKRSLREMIEEINPDANIDILLDPFIELNLVRRDWITGKLDKVKTKRKQIMDKIKNLQEGATEKKEDDEVEEDEEKEREKAEKIKEAIKVKGEYIFLVKDITIARAPNPHILTLLKESENTIYNDYKKELDKFFYNYDPVAQTDDQNTKIASALLKPDIYDFLALMRSNYYPMDKIPKILSEWADFTTILDTWIELKVLTKIKDDKKKEWLILLADLQPYVFFPEYILPKIRNAYKKRQITHEIAKKAYDLLEITFMERVEI
ncbi:MAG: hypothetical protein ACTSR8_07435 [Promethearchaeota archaeon]